jgi:FtsH-binding integral membrane protein
LQSWRPCVGARADQGAAAACTVWLAGLLCAQLLVTALVAAPVVSVPSVKAFVLANAWLTTLAMVTTLALVLTFMVSESARQRYPLNLALLFTFTAAEGLIVGVISSQYQTSTVVLALALTASLTAGLAIYAMRTKTDFTASGGILFACLLGLITASFLMFWLRTPVTQMLLAGGGALLFCVYIVYDVQVRGCWAAGCSGCACLPLRLPVAAAAACCRGCCMQLSPPPKRFQHPTTQPALLTCR